MKSASSLLLAMILLVGIGMPAHAHQKYAYRTKGNSASFSTWEGDDCSYAGISVWAFEQRENGNKTTYNSVYVDYYFYDFCTGESEYGYASLDGASFNQQKLNSATVQGSGILTKVACNYGDSGGMLPPTDPGEPADGGTDPMGDPCTYTEASVDLNLLWTGTGDTYKDRSSSTYNTPYSRYRYRSTGQTRDASLSGSLLIDGSPVDISNGYGSLGQSSSGSFEFYR